MGRAAGIVATGALALAALSAIALPGRAGAADGVEAIGEAAENPAEKQFAMHSYGAQFAQVRVQEETGEIRLDRMLGVFSIGRAINPRTVRSQLIGGMTFGLSMALHEQSVRDTRSVPAGSAAPVVTRTAAPSAVPVKGAPG